MGSSVRRRKSRKRATINSTKYSKKLKKKLIKKKIPQLKTICQSWKADCTLKQNMDALGITFDCNEAVLPSKKVSGGNHNILEALEHEAISSGKARRFKLSKSEARFIIQLINKYGTNYRKMVDDKINVNQLTEYQLRRKCVLAQNN